MKSSSCGQCIWFVSCTQAETIEQCSAFLDTRELTLEQSRKVKQLMSGFAFQQPFDARQVEPSQGIEPVPAGEYKVRISESLAEETKAKDGGLLKLTLEIIEGQYTGRTIFYRLNLFNKNPQAVEIAYRQLSSLCHVTGVFNLQHSMQLHNIPFVAVVANDGQYNEVKRVKDLSGNAPGKTGPSQMSAPAPAAAPPTYAQPPVAAAPPAWGAPPPQAPPQPAAAPYGAPPAAWPPQAAPVQTAPAAWPPAAPPAPPQAPPAAAAPPWAAPPQAGQPAAPPAWTPSGAPPAPPAWGK